MNTKFYSYALGFVLLAGSSYAQEVKPEPLTLDKAIEQALAKSPDLAFSDVYKARAQGAMLSAETRPNPELSFEMENFAGDGPQDGTDAAEFTYGLNQKFELGGKRSKRIASANSTSAMNQLQADLVAKTIRRDVTLAYMDAIAAQRKVELAEQQITTINNIRKVINRRVEAGREPDVQVTKAQVTLQQAEGAYNQAKVDLKTARSQLGMMLGGEALPEALEGDSFDSLLPLPIFTPEMVEDLPEVKLALLNKGRTTAEVNLAKAQAIPDPSLGVGFRQFKETDSKAFLLSLSVPLPVFDANRGGISTAQAEAIEAEVLAEKMKLEKRIEVERLVAMAKAARERIEAVRKDVLPTVEKADQSLLAGYDKGRFTLLDVLDGRRTIQEAQLQLIDTQLTYHNAQANLERLIPKPAEQTQPTTPIPGEQ